MNGQARRAGSTSKNKEKKPRVNTPNENKIPYSIGTNYV